MKCADVIGELERDEIENPGKNKNAWRMEYADYMIEGVPGQPFDGCLTMVCICKIPISKKQFIEISKGMSAYRLYAIRHAKQPFRC